MNTKIQVNFRTEKPVKDTLDSLAKMIGITKEMVTESLVLSALGSKDSLVRAIYEKTMDAVKEMKKHGDPLPFDGAVAN